MLMVSQGLLFSEPSIAETCVWCDLSEGIDPAEWASLCRHIGTLSLKEFECVRKIFLPQHSSVNSKQEGICHPSGNLVKTPLVRIGPSGIGGEYQREI